MNPCYYIDISKFFKFLMNKSDPSFFVFVFWGGVAVFKIVKYYTILTHMAEGVCCYIYNLVID